MLSISRAAYLLLVLFIGCLAALSAVLLLTQAVRNTRERTWANNANVFVIGLAYSIVLGVSIAFYLNRRIVLRRKLQRISKAHRMLGKGDMPKSVLDFVTQEYARACLVAFESLPKGAQHEGWGRPDTDLQGKNFRTSLLETIPDIDDYTRQVIPHQPPLRPHVRMLWHLRTVLALFPRDSLGLTVVHYYDSAIQLARYSTIEPTEEEFRLGMDAALSVKKVLIECRLGGSEESIADLGRFSNEKELL